MAESLHMTTVRFRAIYEGCIEEGKPLTKDYLYNHIGDGAAGFDATPNQKESWRYEIDKLYEQLKTDDGYLVFEYTIPRIGTRPDVVFLYRGIVFVLEFKVHHEAKDGKPEAGPGERRQAKKYAYKLKELHNKSHDHIVVPLLIVVGGDANTEQPRLNIETKVYDLLVINESQIFNVINAIAEARGGEEDVAWNRSWVNGRYNPSPGIIQAMLDRFMNHNVSDIKESGATYGELQDTTDYLIDRINEAQRNKEKAIFFVTGVPGAGKTLVGLNVVANMLREDPETHKRHGASYLSGNDSLVKVMKKALKKDAKENFDYDGEDPDRVEMITDYDSMINLIHTFRSEVVQKLKEDVGPNNQLSFRAGEEDYAIPENVVVFDEAQRAWTHKEIAKMGRDNKVTALQHPNFTYSEPGFLIWSMAQNHDWAAIICLVGGGQSINHGEAGMSAWIEALKDQFPEWRVYLPKIAVEEQSKYSNLDFLQEIKGIEQAQKKYLERVGLPGVSNTVKTPKLHLKTSNRATHASVDAFIEAMLMGDKITARQLYQKFCKVFKLVRTRRIEWAKKWLRTMRDFSDSADDRAGIVLSSRAERMRPEGFIAYKQNHYSRVADWFLEERCNAYSSDFLEIALTEFFVQGLELDWVGLLWDGDFRPIEKGSKKDTNIKDAWEYYGGFDGVKWLKNNDPTNQTYHLNAYRVLLSRARKGMVIVVPEGDATGADPSRATSMYEQINKYLAEVGIEEYMGGEIGIPDLPDVPKQDIK